MAQIMGRGGSCLVIGSLVVCAPTLQVSWAGGKCWAWPVAAGNAGAAGEFSTRLPVHPPRQWCGEMRRRPSSPPPAQLQEATAQADTTSAGSPVAALRAVFTHPQGLAVNPFLPSLPPSTTFTHTHTRPAHHLSLTSWFILPTPAASSQPPVQTQQHILASRWLAGCTASVTVLGGWRASSCCRLLSPSVRPSPRGRAGSRAGLTLPSVDRYSFRNNRTAAILTQLTFSPGRGGAGRGGTLRDDVVITTSLVA